MLLKRSIGSMLGGFVFGKISKHKSDRYWNDLKSEADYKSNYFYMYKDDKRAAEKYIFAGDKEGLRFFCNKQVERIVELWNNNDEFRMHYVENNIKSTVKRLGTFDGRSPGPDEDPSILLSKFYKRPSSGSPSLAVAKSSPVGIYKGNADLAVDRTLTPTVSDRDEVEYAEKVKEEEELARKVKERGEELRKEKAAAEKEQRAKAKEAEERKKRTVRKKRAKKAKKKAREKMTAESDVASGAEINCAPEATEATVSKRPQVAVDVAVAPRTHSEVEPPVPLTLRRKGKRKMSLWIWLLLLSSLMLLALFRAANYIPALNSGP